MSTQPGKGKPVAIINPGNWRYGLGAGEPPDVERLVRPDDPDPPTNPENMPESASVLPPAGQTTFTQIATAVTIHFDEAPGDPDGYWIFGLGNREHSQAVGPNERNIVLRQNNGTGNPYDPETLGNWPGSGPWFCVKAFKNGLVSLDSACNTYQFTDPVGPPPDPTGFQFTAPFFDRFRYNANLQEAAGAELELADDVGGSPGTFEVVAGGPGDDQITEGQLPYDVDGQPAETTKHGRIRSYNIVYLAREYSAGYAGPLAATTGEMPTPGTRPNQPANYTAVLCEYDATQSLFVGQTVPINQGFAAAWSSDTTDTNAKLNITGETNPGVTGSVSASVPIVTHGPPTPHGKPRVWRQRIPAKTAPTFTTNGGGVSFIDKPGTGNMANNENYRAIYGHYWTLMEGHPFQGERCLQAFRYRQIYHWGLCGNHRQGIFAAWNAVDTWGRRVGTTDCVGNPGTSSRVTRLTPSLQITVPNGFGNEGMPTNGIWALGNFGNPTVANTPCVMEVGRWHRIEFILIHSDVDQPNGTYRAWIDNQLFGEFVGIVTRSANATQACPNALGWFQGPSWRNGRTSSVRLLMTLGAWSRTSLSPSRTSTTRGSSSDAYSRRDGAHSTWCDNAQGRGRAEDGSRGAYTGAGADTDRIVAHGALRDPSRHA